MGVSLCSLYVPSGFCWRAGSEVSLGHKFPQGLLAAITLVGGGARDGGTRVSAGVSMSVTVTILLGVLVGPTML